MQWAEHEYICAWLNDWFAGRGFRLDRDANFYDAGAIDSLSVFQLIEELEAKFTFNFDARDFQDRRFSTIAGLAEIVNERLQPR